MAFDDAARAVIKRLRDTAEASLPMPMPDVLGQRRASRKFFDDVIIDGITWFVGYEIEMQVIGPTRHLSISHPGRRMVPGAMLIKEIAEVFGFTERFEIKLSNYIKRGLTVHVLEPYRLLPGQR